MHIGKYVVQTVSNFIVPKTKKGGNYMGCVNLKKKLETKHTETKTLLSVHKS